MTEPTPALSPIAIIRQSLKQLFQNFRTVIGIGLIFSTWYYLLLAVIFAVDHHRIEQGLSQGISYGESPSFDALVYAIALSLVAGLILNPLGFAATAFAIDDSYRGHPTSLRSA